MAKVDFHTHSVASRDGGLREQDYRYFLDHGLLDYIAITDHNDISFAGLMRKRLGARIIVGEEVMSRAGELIGLYLDQPVAPGLSARETAEAIRAQGGLVYIPHPFESVRHGLSFATLTELAHLVDIIELYNGRAIQRRDKLARDWATANGVTVAAASDAHGRAGLGRTYTLLGSAPTRANLIKQLATAEFAVRRPPLLAYAQPRLNRTKRFLRRRRGGVVS